MFQQDTISFENQEEKDKPKSVAQAIYKALSRENRYLKALAHRFSQQNSFFEQWDQLLFDSSPEGKHSATSSSHPYSNHDSPFIEAQIGTKPSESSI
jgi:hypothetical protein